MEEEIVQPAGRDKRGQFLPGSRAAVDAGSKGGRAAQYNGRAHQFSEDERRAGGRNSHAGGRKKG